MKRNIIMASLLLCASATFAQTQKSGIDKTNMDTSVKPGDNFWRYSVGGWLDTHPLDAEHPRNGAFIDLSEQNEKRIQELILNYADSRQERGSLGQKIGSLYNLVMDSVRLNREGAAPLKPYLDKIAAVSSRAGYQLLMAQFDYCGINGLMFSYGCGADIRNAGYNVVSVGQGGLGMGSRDYYFNDDEQSTKVRNAYKEYMKKLFKLVGNSEADATKKMEAVMAIETRIAKVSKAPVELRDINANYHKMTYGEFIAEYPGIDWGNVFLQNGFPPFADIVVEQSEPLHEVEKILAEASLDDLKAYAEKNVLSGAASALSDDFRAVAFEFSQTTSGAQQDRPRWKRAVGTVSGVLGEAIGKLYVEKYFPESSKNRMLALVHNLQEALKQRIAESTWMTPATKEQAIDKLSNFIVKIGYPDKWRDYSMLEVDDSLSLYENMRRISVCNTKYYVETTVNKPVDKEKWHMTPQTINAYYNPTTNEICFPAAILQPPFFDVDADEAANYGAIGVVIAHEMRHGFDDQGSQFDKTGQQRNWWTAEDRSNFEKRTKVLEDYFGKYEILPGKFLNGKLTLGENIGDNGGLNVAFRAMQNAIKKGGIAPKLDGFTPDQRFFLSYGRIWASNATPELKEYFRQIDPHSAAEARVNAALPHINAWYDAFGVKKGNKLFLPKNKRAQVW